ncbi:FolB domain-containing protein [Neisseriaceae bacterium PsAf]|nr:FolB domain-containing protein [Neisseriaceae bacterium PsAf]
MYMDKLQLLGIKFKCKLGVYAWEQQKSQILLLDLILGIENQAKITDSINDTIDYAQLIARIRERYAHQSFQLLEALAEDIAGFLLAEFDILMVEVRLVKPGILPDVREVGIHIVRNNQG